MKPTLFILTFNEETRGLFHNQLDDLLGDYVFIESCSLEKGIKGKIKADLVLTTDFASKKCQGYIDDNTEFLVVRRSLQLSSLDKLINIPEGTRSLLVCSTRESTRETIQFLETVGINHINFIPYFTGDEVPPADLVIITGITKDVPENMKVIDVSKRQVGISTIIQILIKLNLINECADLVIANFVKRLIDLSKRLNSEVIEANKVNKMLKIVIDHVSNGIIYINKEQEIKIFNKMAREIFNVKNRAIVESKINGEIFNINFNKILETGEKATNKIQTIGKDKKVITNIIPIKNRGENTGVMAICKDITEVEKLEETLRRKFKESAHVAKYDFSSIIGKSEKIIETKDRARNLAQSNSTVLIQGETGTGKELFAHAIHNASNRKEGPFIAINCATVPGDLFESELFGYVEGAFTGARKGGKPGVFEQANQGTIFLDEIGDIPKDIQIKLLRVLQEKEIMRIGAGKIIPVDIRVIAATNKNLAEKVREKEFREDLYYRINVLPLQLPPLKERKKDIYPLIKLFLKQFFKDELDITDKVMEKIINYDWPGNIRQLRNCMEWITQTCEKKVKVQHLPDYLLDNARGEILSEEKGLLNKFNDAGDKKNYLFILNELYLARQMDINIGRRQIARNAEINGIELNSQMIRSRLKKLEEFNLVSVGRGRQGSNITEQGINLLKNYSSEEGVG